MRACARENARVNLCTTRRGSKREKAHLDADGLDLLARLGARLVVEPSPPGQAVLERGDDRVDHLLGVRLALAAKGLVDKVAPDGEAERLEERVEAHVVAGRGDVGGDALEAV